MEVDPQERYQLHLTRKDPINAFNIEYKYQLEILNQNQWKKDHSRTTLNLLGDGIPKDEDLLTEPTNAAVVAEIGHCKLELC